MLGMVFTNLMEMVEDRWSLDRVDAVLARARLRGAYTSVGDYPDAELQALLGAMVAETGAPAEALVASFGQHLFDAFVRFHPPYFTGHGDVLDFLEVLDARVHAEVAKLYPSAQPPRITLQRGETAATLTYASRRGLAPLATAMLQASIRRFGGYTLTGVDDLSGGANTLVRYTLSPEARP